MSASPIIEFTHMSKKNPAAAKWSFKPFCARIDVLMFGAPQPKKGLGYALIVACAPIYSNLYPRLLVPNPSYAVNPAQTVDVSAEIARKHRLCN